MSNALGFGGGSGGATVTNAAIVAANGVVTNPATDQLIQPTIDATFQVKQFNGANTADIFQVLSKGGVEYFTIDKDGNALFGGSGAGTTEFTTGAMAVSTGAGYVRIGANTGDKFSVSKGGGAVVEVMDKSLIFQANFNILTPTAADTNLPQMAFGQAITIVRVQCSTDTGTATVNFDERALATPNTAGTNVLSADIVCDSNTQTSCASGCDVNTISNGTIAQYVPLNFQVTSVASTPGVVRMHIFYTID